MNIYPINKLHFSFTTSLKNYTLPITLEFRVLSKKELLNLQSKYYKDNSPNNTYKFYVVKTALLPEYKEYIDEISDNDIDSIYKKIADVSKVTPDLLEELKDSFDIMNYDGLKTDTFDCDYCKETGNLQKDRNCAFLKDCKDCNKDFVYVIDGKIYRNCPKSLINMPLLKAGYDCYFMYNKGLLPEEGGMLDQTEFFIEVGINMFSWLKKYENNLMKQDDG